MPAYRRPFERAQARTPLTGAEFVTPANVDKTPGSTATPTSLQGLDVLKAIHETNRQGAELLAILGRILVEDPSVHGTAQQNNVLGVVEAVAQTLRSTSASLEALLSGGAPVSVAVPSTASSSLSPELTLKSAIDRYLEEKAQTTWRGKKTWLDLAPMLLEFTEFFPGRTLDGLCREDLAEYRRLLLTLPKNRLKSALYRGLSLRQILARRIPIEDRLDPVTVRNRASKIRSFLTWARGTYGPAVLPEGIEDALRITGKPGDFETPVKPFTREDLAKIFAPKTVKAGAPAPSWQHWLPLLALYTGARLEELCQLRVCDVRREGEVQFIAIDDSEGKNLKTRGSRRSIPLHPALIEAGFLSYVRSLPGGARASVFPELSTRAETGKRGDTVSKWFSRRLKTIGIARSSRELVFHSFRHTFAQAWKDQGLDDHQLRQILGHREGSLAYGVYANQPFNIGELADSIFKLHFGLAADAIRPSEEACISAEGAERAEERAAGHPLAA